MEASNKVNYYRLSLQGGQLHRMELTKQYRLAGQGGGVFSYIAPVFDTGEFDTTYHRLLLDSSFHSCKYEIDVVATNQDISEIMYNDTITFNEKLEYSKEFGYERRVNTNDMLLHGISGRYLWIMIQVSASELASNFTIEGFSFEFPKSSFTEYLPEIYQEEQSFFPRYMAVLQSLYVDLEKCIDEIPTQLDYTTCESGYLNEYVEWTGLKSTIINYTPDQIRYLIENLNALQSGKGTSKVLKDYVKLITGCDVQVIEFFKWNDWMKQHSTNVEHYQKLFGKDENVFTLIVNCVDHKQQELPDKQMIIKCLEETVPLGMHCNIVYLNENNNMDVHSYLDVNSTLSTPMTADTKGFILGSNQLLG